MLARKHNLGTKPIQGESSLDTLANDTHKSHEQIFTRILRDLFPEITNAFVELVSRRHAFEAIQIHTSQPPQCRSAGSRIQGDAKES